MKKNLIFFIALIPIIIITILKLSHDKKNRKEACSQNAKIKECITNSGKIENKEIAYVEEVDISTDKKVKKSENESKKEKDIPDIIVKANPDSGVYHLPECRYYNSKSCTLKLTEKEAIKKQFSKCKLE